MNKESVEMEMFSTTKLHEEKRTKMRKVLDIIYLTLSSFVKKLCVLRG